MNSTDKKCRTLPCVDLPSFLLFPATVFKSLFNLWLGWWCFPKCFFFQTWLDQSHQNFKKCEKQNFTSTATVVGLSPEVSHHIRDRFLSKNILFAPSSYNFLRVIDTFFLRVCETLRQDATNCLLLVGWQSFFNSQATRQRVLKWPWVWLMFLISLLTNLDQNKNINFRLQFLKAFFIFWYRSLSN